MTPQENFNSLNPFIWENEGFIDKYIAMLAHIPVCNGSTTLSEYLRAAPPQARRVSLPRPAMCPRAGYPSCAP